MYQRPIHPISYTISCIDAPLLRPICPYVHLPLTRFPYSPYINLPIYPRIYNPPICPSAPLPIYAYVGPRAAAGVHGEAQHQAPRQEGLRSKPARTPLRRTPIQLYARTPVHTYTRTHVHTYTRTHVHTYCHNKPPLYPHTYVIPRCRRTCQYRA
jgi:hypothetical protein